jgi:hypothetical protein
MLPGAMEVSSCTYYHIQHSIFLAGYDNKILTSARNGDLIMWDLNKAGNAKYGAYARLV